jgi:hypothetical protein
MLSLRLQEGNPIIPIYRLAELELVWCLPSVGPIY